MEIYLVGGAVRDTLLGLPVTERDWVVVGATPEDMVALGYQPVGKDFPVFLHPKTKEEYALARTERKTARGYKGFQFNTCTSISLEEDLLRRDLTINAMAMDSQGEVIDPYDGQADLANKVLRHVSPAFVEDPVRLLRIARFAARFAPQGFTVADETMTLLRQMVANGEIDALVAERVWAEFAKALVTAAPLRFLQLLDDATALAVLFPELRTIDWLEKTAIIKKLDSAEQVFACLFLWAADADLKAFCQRYRVPKNFSQQARLARVYAQAKLGDEPAENVLCLLERLDAFRRPEQLQMILVLFAVIGSEFTPIDPVYLSSALSSAQKVDVQGLIATGYQGGELAKQLRLARKAEIMCIKCN